MIIKAQTFPSSNCREHRAKSMCNIAYLRVYRDPVRKRDSGETIRIHRPPTVWRQPAPLAKRSCSRGSLTPARQRRNLHLRTILESENHVLSGDCALQSSLRLIHSSSSGMACTRPPASSRTRTVAPIGRQCGLNPFNPALPSPAPPNQADRFADLQVGGLHAGRNWFVFKRHLSSGLPLGSLSGFREAILSCGGPNNFFQNSV